MNKILFFNTQERPSSIAARFTYFFDEVKEAFPAILWDTQGRISRELQKCTTVVLQEQFDKFNPKLAERIMQKVWGDFIDPYTRVIFLSDMFPYHRHRAVDMQVDSFGPIDIIENPANYNWLFGQFEKGRIKDKELNRRGTDVACAPDAPRTFQENQIGKNGIPWYAARR